MQSVLILGAKGMLGQELVKSFSKKESYEVIAWDRDDFDVSDEKILREKVSDLWPDIILNACAYNAVDVCEIDDEEYEKAKILNTHVPGVLAEIAKDLRSIFVHYSTDYVFDGNRPQYRLGGRAPGCCGSGCSGCSYKSPSGKFDGYRENDLPNPLSRYGMTKYEGEQKIEKVGDQYYIFRLSKLFGKSGFGNYSKQCFFESIEKLAKTQNEVRVVDGEISCFTYAPDLALQTEKILSSGLAFGIYHLVNKGEETWYSATKKLFDEMGIHTKLTAVSPNEFKRNATRPERSVLVSTKIEAMRNWEEALKDYIKENKKV
ncbi:MAG: NAD(P)-dependent oxidoreductase [Candidatus Moraniibacteriota bacterium]|nr:MAG: NAD(P)-dependent oxidoreductase [Candidatus Moranbacteria bacterium]